MRVSKLTWFDDETDDSTLPLSTTPMDTGSRSSLTVESLSSRLFRNESKVKEVSTSRMQSCIQICRKTWR